MEEQPSSSSVWEANTYEEENLAALQGASNFHQGMIENPSLVISANNLDGSISLHAVDPEQQNNTALSNDGGIRNHSSCEHSESSFIQEAMKESVRRGRHLEIRNSFTSLDDTLSMSMPQLKERLLLSADPRPLWFWKDMHEEEISWRDFSRGALPHFMECKIIHQFEEVLPSLRNR